MTFVSAWPDTHVEALKANFHAGMSYAENAAEINATFRTKYSRNACIGKGKRVGLSVAQKPRPPVETKPAEKKTYIKLPNRRPMVVRAEPTTDVVPQHITIDELTSTTCRWPFGNDAPYTFCGCYVFGGSSYCAGHYFVSIGAGTFSERAAHRVSG